LIPGNTSINSTGNGAVIAAGSGICPAALSEVSCHQHIGPGLTGWWFGAYFPVNAAIGAVVNLGAVGSTRQQMSSSTLTTGCQRGNINIALPVVRASIKVGGC